MPLYATLASLSQAAGANAANGAVDAPSTVDDNMNLLASFIAILRDTYATTATTTGKTGSSGPIVLRNRIINGNFAINQRGVSGTVTLAAGAYGHDRWKAGASGCTYTYAVALGVTTITITAGTLVQVVESGNIEGGIYCMSWTGTATGRIAGGTFSASGINSTSQTGGTNVSVEFATGTLASVQLEPGTVPTPAELRPYSLELLLCKRYYQQVAVGYQAPVTSSGIYGGTIQLPIDMRVSPTATWVTDNGNLSFPLNGLFLTVVSPSWINFSKIASATGNGFYASSVACVAEL